MIYRFIKFYSSMNQKEKDNIMLINLKFFRSFLKIFTNFFYFIVALSIPSGIFFLFFTGNKQFFNANIALTSGLGFTIIMYILKKGSTLFLCEIEKQIKTLEGQIENINK